MRRFSSARMPRKQRQARLRLEELESRTLLSVAYTPTQIRTAYGITGDGAGQTIAIVDAYYDANIVSDLTAFNTKYGLAPLNGQSGNGSFTVIDQSNMTPSPANDDWSVETALDVEWAHAVAPKANIVLVLAKSDNLDSGTMRPTDLLNAVLTAAAYQDPVTHAKVSTVSMSWGLNEVSGETAWDSVFTQPGVTYFAASGDSGAGTIWPAVSPNVVAVGGTTLTLNSANAITKETGWGNGKLSYFFGGSGGGFSVYEPLPSFQKNVGISSTYTQFGVRLSPDVAYDADPNTGFNVISGGKLYVVGGTSAGSPQWAAILATVDQARAAANLAPLSTADTLKALYANPAAFHDITSGNTGAYTVYNSRGRPTGTIQVSAAPGYDLVTGLGSPKTGAIVAALSSSSVGTALQQNVAPLGGGTPSGQSSIITVVIDTPDGDATPGHAPVTTRTFVVVVSIAGADALPLPIERAPLIMPPPVPEFLLQRPTSAGATASDSLRRDGGGPDVRYADEIFTAQPGTPALLPSAPMLEPPAQTDTSNAQVPEQPIALSALDTVLIEQSSTDEPGVPAEAVVAKDHGTLLAASVVLLGFAHGLGDTQSRGTSSPGHRHRRRVDVAPVV